MNVINPKKIALKVSVITIVINFLLTAFKIVIGILGNSSAMISDGVHSASDVLSTVIIIISVLISSRPKDEEHQYGHERYECVASIVLSVLLFGTGLVIGYKGIHSLIDKSYMDLKAPHVIALVAAIVSILVKEFMFWFTYYYSKKINSLSLKADAWHHRSDALSSVGSLIGIGCAILFKLPVADVIAAVVISLFIIKVALEIFKEAVNKMVDKSCDKETTDKIINTALSVKGVLSIDEIKTRMFGNKIYVDIEIGAYENLSLKEAHAIAEEVHNKIEQMNLEIKHCMVHVNPSNKGS